MGGGGRDWGEANPTKSLITRKINKQKGSRVG